MTGGIGQASFPIGGGKTVQLAPGDTGVVVSLHALGFQLGGFELTPAAWAELVRIGNGIVEFQIAVNGEQP